MTMKAGLCFRFRSRRMLLAAAAVFACRIALCASWQAMGPDGGHFVGSISDPADANRIVVVEENAKQTLESLDGGSSWEPVGNGPNSSIQDFAAFNQFCMYANDYYRCYRTSDAGRTWSNTSFPSGSGYYRALSVHPTINGTLYAAGYDWNGSSYSFAFAKSTDSGASWNVTPFFSFDSFYPYDMSVSRSSPNRLFVCGYKRVGDLYNACLLRSTDGGATWSDISAAVTTTNYRYLYAVAVDPTDHNRVYVGGTRIYRSTDGGDSWAESSTTAYTYELAVDPAAPQNVYAAYYGRMYVSSDYGQTWSYKGGAIAGWPNHVEVAAADPATVIVSTEIGLYKSTDGGATWNDAHGNIKNAVVPALAVAPSLTSRLYVESDGQSVYASENCGETWNEKGYFVACGNVAALCVHPTTPDIVLALEGSG